MKAWGVVFAVAIIGCSDAATVSDAARPATDAAVDVDAVPPCPPGYADCDRYPGHSCESHLGSTSSCGRCGNRCPERPGMLATCDGVRCGLVCLSGLGDCDRIPGNGCETELTTNLDGRCPLLPPRPWRPQSVTSTTSRRPTFEWHLPMDVSSARLEVCADRACSRVELAVDVFGESYRPSTPLATGVHYWRLRGRAGDRLSSGFSATWLFRSPTTEATYDTAWSLIPDVDGDGAADWSGGEDVVVSSTGLGWRPDYWRDEVDMALSNYFLRLSFAGDLDGDGYGDLLGVSGHRRDRVGVTYRAGWFRGGPRGPRSTRWMDLTGITAVDLNAGYADLYVIPLGDVEGDGLSDFALRRDGNGFLDHYLALSSDRFTETSVGGGIHSELAAIGDIDGDGRSDVLFLRRDSEFPGLDSIPTSRLVVGSSPRIYTPLPACGTASAIQKAPSLSVADNDGDGLTDLTLLDAASRPLARYFGTPAGFRADRCALTP
ncbi:MAG: putative integrin-like protein [Myxococcaceae bacterium]|nr:putative integrin-like protein [Myxococcaceae bacterium]